MKRARSKEVHRQARKPWLHCRMPSTRCINSYSLAAGFIPFEKWSLASLYCWVTGKVWVEPNRVELWFFNLSTRTRGMRPAITLEPRSSQRWATRGLTNEDTRGKRWNEGEWIGGIVVFPPGFGWMGNPSFWAQNDAGRIPLPPDSVQPNTLDFYFLPNNSPSSFPSARNPPNQTQHKWLIGCLSIDTSSLFVWIFYWIVGAM